MPTMDDFGLKGQSMKSNNSEEIQPMYPSDTKEVTPMTTSGQPQGTFLSQNLNKSSVIKFLCCKGPLQ